MIDYPRIIAHRCGGALAAENSLAGLALAAGLGCRGVEFDVMLSADGVPLLIHDETIDRTTDGHGRVAGMSAEALRRFDAGGEPIPLFAEALDHCRRLGLWANVEIKPAAGCEAATGEVVGGMLARNGLGRGIVSSFSLPALRAARRRAPEIPVAVLFGRLPADWRRLAGDAGAVAVHFAADHADAATLAAIRAAGCRAACFTVNDRAAGDRLLADGADAIFTDRPDLWSASEM